MGDGLRLAVGTLTVLRVPPPAVVDARSARAAMLLAPVAGLLPAGAAALVVLAADAARLSPLAGALAALAAAAWLTRGLHLDGLADTADGLAAGYDRERALTVMRRGDVGPAGAVTLVLAVGLQAAALDTVGGGPVGAAAALVGLGAARAVLPLACVRGVPAARPDGLGAAVTGTVPRWAAALVAVAVAAAAGAVTAALGAGPLPGAAAALAGLTAAAALLARCVRRLGGTTGDVLGAGVEVAATAALLVLAATL